jgi:hypothetical protein
MTDIFTMMNDVRRSGIEDEPPAKPSKAEVREMRRSRTFNPATSALLSDPEDEDSDFDDGDSDEEEEVCLDDDDLARASTSDDIDDLVRDLAQSSSDVAALDVDADPYKKYYELSLRLLQHGAARTKEKARRQSLRAARDQRDGSGSGTGTGRDGGVRTSSSISSSSMSGYADGDLQQEEVGGGLKNEGRSVSDLMRAEDVSSFLKGLINSCKAGTSEPTDAAGMAAEGHQKQIKLVTHTFGPGCSTRHPWTNRGDNGINSRVWRHKKRTECGVVGLDGDDNGDWEDIGDQDEDTDGQAHSSRRGDEIYYVGIIDILQQYTMSKRLETVFKGMLHDSELISSVDSVRYARRFIRFMDENIK